MRTAWDRLLDPWWKGGLRSELDPPALKGPPTSNPDPEQPDLPRRSRIDLLRSPTLLVRALMDAFADLERRGGRVGRIYLNRREIDTLLRRRDAFDATSAQIRAAVPGYEGVLWGARVHVSEHVPVGHAVVVPDDMEVAILGPACSLPL